MVWGQDLLFSIIHLSLLSFDSLLTFTISVMFFTNTFCYIVWWLVSPFSFFYLPLMMNTYLLRWWLIVLFPAYSPFHDVPLHSMTWSVHDLWKYKYYVVVTFSSSFPMNSCISSSLTHHCLLLDSSSLFALTH